MRKMYYNVCKKKIRLDSAGFSFKGCIMRGALLPSRGRWRRELLHRLP